MDAAARAALAALVRSEARTELASELDQLAELRMRLAILEARAGVPTGLPKGARLRQREVIRLRREGLSLRAIALRLACARATVESDLARAQATLPEDVWATLAADGKAIGARGNGRRPAA